MLIVLRLIFNSCQEIAIIKYSIDDAKQQAKIREITNPYYGKDGAWSYQTNKEVLNIVKEVLKRPINKEIQFDGIKIMIPEDTRINPQKGTIVDVKTGYGLPITFLNKSACTKKKVRENVYYGILYNEKIPGVEELAQKIIKANGFVNTCK